MIKCINECPDPAEANFTWTASDRVFSANFCGCCAAMWWSRFKNTDAGQFVEIGAPEKIESH